MKRREFLTASVSSGFVFMTRRIARSGPVAIDLEEATVASLAAAMGSGAATARSIAEGYLARIKDLDRKLNSVIELNRDALAVADERDRARKAGKTLGPLDGIPDPHQGQYRHSR
jgi:amidase